MVVDSETAGEEAVEAATTAGKRERSGSDPENRLAEGRALRAKVPRSSHAEWEPPDDRPDPVEQLQDQDVTRDQSLLPIRYGRMLASPFAFLRGSATVMARDLASTPTTGLIVQACGDAHLSNFGSYATPERKLVFDLNDFDETLPAPWEWDVKRLATSFVVASRTNGFSTAESTRSAQMAVRSYREHMASFAHMRQLDVWYSNINALDVMNMSVLATKKDRKAWDRGTARASRRGHLQALAKMTTVVDGKLRIVDDPYLIEHYSDELVGDRVPTFATAYRSSLRDDVRALLQRYRFADFARKTVGVGSVGTRCYIILMTGNGDQDPLFLQIKEATTSVLEPYAGKSQYRNHGQRVVRGQQYLQAASDIFLGWGRFETVDLYVRQLRDMKGSVDVSQLSPNRMVLYAELCGWALARAHARSGDPAKIAGYLGAGKGFDDAVAVFAHTYANQTERDHAALVEAVKSGRVKADVSDEN